MPISKYCEMCAAKFEARTRHAVFCSKECRIEWNNQRRSIDRRFNTMIEYINNAEVPKSLEELFIDNLRELERECRRVNTRTGTEKQEKLI